MATKTFDKQDVSDTSVPGAKKAKNRTEYFGNPYFYRPMMGHSMETRMRQIAGNSYGANTSKEPSNEGIFDITPPQRYK